MVGNPFTVMASPENLPLLRSTLAALDIDAKTIITDFAEYNNFCSFLTLVNWRDDPFFLSSLQLNKQIN